MFLGLFGTPLLAKCPPESLIRDPDECIDGPAVIEGNEDRTIRANIRGENFGGGIASTSWGSSGSEARAVWIRSDGRFYVVGRSQEQPGEWQLAIARFQLSGGLDTSFASTGKLLQSLHEADDSPYAIQIDSSNRLVIGGRSSTATDLDFAVWRYQSNGDLDTSFAGNGMVRVSIGTSFDVARAMLVDTSGRIVLSGYSYEQDHYQAAIVRLLSDGQLDTSFQTSGKWVFSLGTSDVQFSSLNTDMFGRYSVGGSVGDSDWNNLMARVQSNGSLDTNFATQGWTTLSFSTGDDVVFGTMLDTFGRYLGVGLRQATTTNNDGIIFRLSTNGSLDTAFNTRGYAFTTILGSTSERSAQITLGTTQKSMVTGLFRTSNTAPNGSEVFLARYHSNGTIDTSWNTNGRTLVTVSSGNDEPYAVAYYTDHAFFVAGKSGASHDWFIARYDVNGALAPAGKPDPDFGTNGISVASTYIPIATSVMGYFIQSDGKTLYLGSSSSFGHFLRVSRRLSNGSLDTSFRTIGYGFITNESSPGRYVQVLTDGSYAIPSTSRGAMVRFLSNGLISTFLPGLYVQGGPGIVDNQNRSYVPTHSSNNFVITRYTSSGTLDSSFGTNGRIFRSVGGLSDYSNWNFLAVETDGRLIVAQSVLFSQFLGTTLIPVQSYLWRLQSNGSLDTSYGVGGYALLESRPRAQISYFQQDSTDPNRILIAERTDLDGASGYTYSRYLLSGVLDTSFGISGRYEYATGTQAFYPVSLRTTGDGKYVGTFFVTGGFNAFTQIGGFRLNSNFSLDTSFGTDGILSATTIFQSYSFAQSDVIVERNGFLTFLRGNATRVFP